MGCPVDDQVRAWVDTHSAWLADTLGRSVLDRPVLTPTPANFGAVSGRDFGTVRAVVNVLATHVGVESDGLDVEIFDDEDRAAVSALRTGAPWSSHRAGDWSQRDGRSVIAIESAIVESPRALVATVAHELGHEILLGNNWIEVDRADGEQLTDLATVFLGLGIFTANAAHEFEATGDGWRASRLGYLDEATMGYALARYSSLRGESSPAWMRYLDTNPATFMRQATRFLESKD